MDRETATLQAKIDARNRLNELIVDVYNSMVLYFEPFVNAQVFKKDGTLTKRVSDNLPTLRPSASAHHDRLTLNRTKRSLEFVVTVCQHVTGHECCLYDERVVCIGDVQAGRLAPVFYPAPGDVRTDYNLQEVRAKQKAVKDAEQALRDAEGELYPFR